MEAQISISAWTGSIHVICKTWCLIYPVISGNNTDLGVDEYNMPQPKRKKSAPILN